MTSFQFALAVSGSKSSNDAGCKRTSRSKSCKVTLTSTAFSFVFSNVVVEENGFAIFIELFPSYSLVYLMQLGHIKILANLRVFPGYCAMYKTFLDIPNANHALLQMEVWLRRISQNCPSLPFLRVDVETLVLIIYNNSALECLIVASVPNEMFIGQSEVAFNLIYKAFRF